MVYELVIMTNGRISFVPEDLRYFDNHFVCKSMADYWEIPPAKIIGTSGKMPDFVSWMLRAPVISERARDNLANICDGLVEFLPFHNVKNRKNFAVNVLNLDSGREIFKKFPSSAVFVRKGFGEVVRDNGLTGVELADPNDDIGKKIVRGEHVNCFPGVVG
jgi:hypothetical protein